MACKDTGISNPNEDCCGSNNLWLEEDRGRVELKTIKGNEFCDSEHVDVEVEEQCETAGKELSVSIDEGDKNTRFLSPEKPALTSDFPKTGCCDNKIGVDNNGENVVRKGDSDCKKQEINDDVGGRGNERMICDGKREEFDCLEDRQESGLESCFEDKEQCSCPNENDKEVKDNANCLDSCCDEQNVNVEFINDDATEVRVKDHEKLDSCSDNSGVPTCSPEVTQAVFVGKGDQPDTSPNDEDCCASKDCRKGFSQDSSLKEPLNLNEKVGSTAEARVECSQQTEKTSRCCDTDNTVCSRNDGNCEKQVLLSKKLKVKNGNRVSPTHKLNEMGNKSSYGSTVKSDANSEGQKFLDIRSFKYTALPGSARDAEDSSRNEIEVSIVEPHVKTTKFRIQNICCGKEADMMKRELEPLKGISSVSVNVVGRIGFVSHDTNVISATDIVNILNKLHLGVSIMESGSKEGEKLLRKEVIIRLAGKSVVLGVLTALFIVVLIGRVHNYNWMKWVAITEIVIGVVPIIRKIVINFMKKIFIDINLLMLIAVAGTVSLQEWIEGATLVFVFAIAEVLQQYCGYKVQCAISGIMVQVPDRAVLAETGKSVPIDEIEIGTRIIVCAGEKIALDGEVVKGQAAVDESSITGEAIPIEKGEGDKTHSGTIVQNGYLEIITTSTSQTSTVSKVTQMVQEAQSKASHTEKIMNSFAKIYTPLVLITALLVFAIPAILAELKVGKYESQLHLWGIRALIVLLIACPCALLMSVPIPIVCGITAAAKNGALVKSGTDMETLAKIRSVAFDKTGTLTEGRFKVVNIKEFGDNLQYSEMLKLVVALEAKSSHPVAAALVNHYSGCITDKIASFGANVGLPDVTDFTSVPGQGLKGTVSGHAVVVGNLKLLRDCSVQVSLMAERLFASWSNRGQTVIFCSIDRQLSMMIGLADTPRATAKMTVQMLKNLGITSIILTGDCSGAAATVMKATGAENYIASMKPEHKLEWIRKAQKPSPKTRFRVAMIGDGVNDGPSLAAADVGIAIGACATALAIESAGVALMSENLNKIPELLVLSRFTRLVVIQNIAIALVIKFAVLIATMFGSLALWMAVLSDVAGLLLVILNGIRPLLWKWGRRREYAIMKEADNPEVEVLVVANEREEEDEGLVEITL